MSNIYDNSCDGGSDCYEDLKDIQNKHMDERGYDDVGYK